MGMTNHPIGPHPPETTTLDDVSKFGHLILRKIIKFLATVQMPDFKAKMHQIRFLLGGSAPDPAGGAYRAPHTP